MIWSRRSVLGRRNEPRTGGAAAGPIHPAGAPIRLTVEELDFGNYPARNRFPGIPVNAWIRFPDCAELVDEDVYA